MRWLPLPISYISVTLLAVSTLSGCANFAVGWNHGQEINQYAGRWVEVAMPDGSHWLTRESDYDRTLSRYVRNNGDPDYLFVVNTKLVAFVYVDHDGYAEFHRTGLSSNSTLKEFESIPQSIVDALPALARADVLAARVRARARHKNQPRLPGSVGSLKSTATSLCDDFSSRVKHGDNGRAFTFQKNGWGAIYSYLENAGKKTSLHRLMADEMPDRTLAIAVHAEWVRRCASGAEASNGELDQAMRGLASRYETQPSPPPAKRDMSAQATLKYSTAGKGYKVQSSRPLHDSEMASYTRRLGDHLDRRSIPSVMFLSGTWRAKTKLYPDESVRVIKNGSSKVYAK